MMGSKRGSMSRLSSMPPLEYDERLASEQSILGLSDNGTKRTKTQPSMVEQIGYDF